MGYWAVIVVLAGVLVLSQNGIGIAQPTGSTQLRSGYACWGGCYNECILLNGKNPTQRLPCYLQCLGNCVAQPASDNQYYCQLGCSLEQCVMRFSSAGKCTPNLLSPYLCIAISYTNDKPTCIFCTKAQHLRLPHSSQSHRPKCFGHSKF